MLTPQQKSKLRTAGYNDNEIAEYERTKFPQEKKSFVDKALDTGTAVTNFLGGRAVANTFGAEIAKSRAGSAQEREFISQAQPGVKETLGSALQLGSTFIPGVAGANLAKNTAIGAATGYLQDVGSGLQNNESVGQSLLPGVGTAIGAVIPAGLYGVGRGATPLLNTLQARMAQKAAAPIQASRPGVMSGSVQTLKELGERVPRAVNRVREGAAEAATRAERIRTAPPKVANAIKQGLEDRFINVVTTVDDPTKKAFKEVTDMAEEVTSGLSRKNPTIVGGELAAEQYDLINKQRRSIGQQIGELSKRQSQELQVPMQQAYQDLDDILVANNILPPSRTGESSLVFRGKFTKAQRSRINELYDLATELGDSATPRELLDNDQLFSGLNREAMMENLKEIFVEVPGSDETKNIFSVFRDVYAKTFDANSPDDIRTLNSQYQKLRTLQDDIEDSIFKTPNFEVVKSTNPAEFAKVNLRRIFGEAQSSPVYETIADQMDAVARELGYSKATPKDVAEFAQAIRKLYPDIIPSTGFTGSLRLGIGDIISGVLDAGKADLRDQRSALRGLLEEIIEEGGFLDPLAEIKLPRGQGVQKSSSLPTSIAAEVKTK